MNRQIKFRVWSNQMGRFLSKEEYALDLDGKLIFVEIQQNSSVKLIAVNPSFYVIQQFTGLIDKNDKEIYEGDIVKITNIDTEEKFSPDVRILEVNWGGYDDGEYVDNVECWMAGNYHSVSELIRRTKYLGDNKWKLSVEKIGNILENPELLKI